VEALVTEERARYEADRVKLQVSPAFERGEEMSN